MNAIIIQTITMITYTTNCMLLIFCKSSTICSCLGILIINNGRNVLLIEFALVEGMPELLVFIVINVVSIACIVFQYFIKNMIIVITSMISNVKVTLEKMTNKTCHIPKVFVYFLHNLLRFKNCNILCINHMHQYIL